MILVRELSPFSGAAARGGARDSRGGQHSGAEREAAFTFVEILAALAFLGILMPVLISALLVSSRAGSVAERRTTAVQLGENKISELMIDNAWTSATSRGEFGDAWPGYRWELKQDAGWQNGAMTELTLDVFFKTQGQENDVTLTTLVNADLNIQ